MKRFWLVMLALGMLFAFSSSVFAADVKFTGSFYAAGMYQSKTSLMKDGGVVYVPSWGGISTVSAGDNSTAFYYQRLRVGMYFIVTPALSLVTRFDAMERVWGAPRSAAGATDAYGRPIADVGSVGTVAENENIAFDWAYIQYVSPIGAFLVGYQQDGAWGTVFGDNSIPLAKIQYVIRTGPVTAGAYAGKIMELSRTAKYATGVTDQDTDKYVAFVNYAINKDIQVGLLGSYIRDASDRDGQNNTLNVMAGPNLLYKLQLYTLQPYFKAKVGPVALEGEFQYGWGQVRFEDDSLVPGTAGTKIKIENNMALYLNAVADLGMFYVGGTFAWLSGDKTGTADKIEGGLLNGGIDWNPALILFNFDKTYWAGAPAGHVYLNTPGAGVPYNTSPGSTMKNAWFYQGRVGVRPVPALDIMAALTYAQADKKPGSLASVSEKDYGWELDVTATYAITNNLSYMLGVGYLWTGDYYKGYNPAGVNKVNDDYLVINKLTLTF